MIAIKNSMLLETFNITQRIKNIEQTNCRDEVKHFWEENNSKYEILKILSENIASIAISTNTQVQHREIMQTSNSSNDTHYQVKKKLPNNKTQVTVIRRSLLCPIDLKI